MYGIDAGVLYNNNPQINDECSNIYIGEVLCVDTDSFSYPSYNQTAYDVRPLQPTFAKLTVHSTSRTLTFLIATEPRFLFLDTCSFGHLHCIRIRSSRRALRTL